MMSTEKIKRTSLALFTLASLVLLWFIIQGVKGFVLNTTEWHAAGIITFSIGMLIVLAILVIALVLLFSIRKEETPFHLKNVRRLKVIAILLMSLEPYHFISEWISNHFYPMVLSDHTAVSVHASWGGSILVAGVVVYCISLVFEYGISLQKQVDETL